MAYASGFRVAPEALAALAALREGNERFVRSETTLKITDADRRNAVTGQNPVAVVLGCSDSRVPTEVVFDQGVGELFVIRVAGNIVQPSQIGSVEFAAQKFGTRLVVVLGHTHCGAIEATVEELQRPADSQSRNIASIVNRIRPSVANLLAETSDREELIAQAVRANVRYSANALRHGSDIVESLVRDEGLLIVGAEYSLKTGVVEFFDGAPATD
jgi:carbonic anhydrase